MLLVAVMSWVLFTLPIGFVRPPVVSCKYHNGSQYLLKMPEYGVDGGGEEARRRRRRSVDTDFPERLDPDTVEVLPRALPLVGGAPWSRTKRAASDHSWAPGHVVGASPQSIRFVTGYDASTHTDWVSPTFSNEVFERAQVQKVFFLILLLVVIGEFVSSPAVALADSAVITLLGEQNQVRPRIRLGVFPILFANSYFPPSFPRTSTAASACSVRSVGA